MLTDIRDLGAHLTCARKPRATFLKVRVQEAAPIAKRIGGMKLNTPRRIKALKTKVVPKALYWVKATQMPEGAVKKLQAAVVDAARRFRSRTRSPALAL